MSTRSIVPRNDTEGGLGTALKRWGLGWINALVVNSIKIVTGAGSTKVLTSDADGNATWQTASGLDLANNLKFVVNGSVNKLDIFTKSGGAVPDNTNYPTISIPDGTGYTQRTRKATYLSGTSQFIMADAANYWSKGSLAAEIKTAYVYAIWDTAGGIVWALGGYSGFTRVPASTTETDDDFFLLEASSTYTKVITDYCVCVGKIRYQYDTADNPDHTIQATVLDAPQVIWNPKSDYGYSLALASNNISGGDIAEYSVVSSVIKQSGKYLITPNLVVSATSIYAWLFVKTGSAVYGSAIYKAMSAIQQGAVDFYGNSSCPVIVSLNAGDTIHLGASLAGSVGNRIIYTHTRLSFYRID